MSWLERKEILTSAMLDRIQHSRFFYGKALGPIIENEAGGGSSGQKFAEAFDTLHEPGSEGGCRLDLNLDEPAALTDEQVHFVSMRIPEKIQIGPPAAALKERRKLKYHKGGL